MVTHTNIIGFFVSFNVFWDYNYFACKLKPIKSEVRVLYCFKQFKYDMVVRSYTFVKQNQKYILLNLEILKFKFEHHSISVTPWRHSAVNRKVDKKKLNAYIASFNKPSKSIVKIFNFNDSKFNQMSQKAIESKF